MGIFARLTYRTADRLPARKRTTHPERRTATWNRPYGLLTVAHTHGVLEVKVVVQLAGAGPAARKQAELLTARVDRVAGIVLGGTR